MFSQRPGRRTGDLCGKPSVAKLLHTYVCTWYTPITTDYMHGVEESILGIHPPPLTTCTAWRRGEYFVFYFKLEKFLSISMNYLITKRVKEEVWQWFHLHRKKEGKSRTPSEVREQN